MRSQLRIDHDDEDALIQSYIDAAVAHFDGYRGVLGRAIMPQTWAVDLPAGGDYRLPLPDVTGATASTGTVSLCHDALGAVVTVSEACTVTFACALPEELLPAVKQAAIMLAAHWYENREAVSQDQMTAVPMAVDMLIGAARWGHRI